MARLIIRTHDEQQFVLPIRESFELNVTQLERHDWISFTGLNGDMLGLHTKNISSIHFDKQETK